jgi:hypothetical protein
MHFRHLLVAVTALSVAAAAPSARLAPRLAVGFRNEPGVETKAIFAGSATLVLTNSTAVWGGIAFSAGDNPGIAHYGVSADVVLVEAIRFRLRAQVDHNQWSSWRWGENRAAAMVLAGPRRGMELGFGAAYRAPILDPTSYYSPFRWQSSASEWNLLYSVQWTFIQQPQAGLAVWIANDDPLTPHLAQQFPFGLSGDLRVSPHWRLNARLGSDIKGLSGALFSLGELDARAGISYAP